MLNLIKLQYFHKESVYKEVISCSRFFKEDIMNKLKYLIIKLGYWVLLSVGGA